MKPRKLIKRRRKELGMSQYELARKLGYSRSAIANWENGHRPIYPIKPIARVLRISASRLER